jgi:hypothetical protein
VEDSHTIPENHPQESSVPGFENDALLLLWFENRAGAVVFLLTM